MLDSRIKSQSQISMRSRGQAWKFGASGKHGKRERERERKRKRKRKFGKDRQI